MKKILSLKRATTHLKNNDELSITLVFLEGKFTTHIHNLIYAIEIKYLTVFPQNISNICQTITL